jgi:hypothetical protein
MSAILEKQREEINQASGTPPLWIPECEILLPTAGDYINFRKKYPRLGGGQVAGAGRPQQQQPQALIPFIASAHEHAETAPLIQSKRAAKNPTEVFEFNIPSYGYIRNLWLDVEVTPGKAASGAEASADSPFNAIQELTLLDTNGAPIFGPLTGYNTFLSNLFGGYTYQQDVRTDFYYKKIQSGGEARFQLRIPIEISHHDGTGCVGNQNAAAPYRVRLVLNSNEAFYKKEPEEPTKSEWKVRPILEAWSLPNAVDALGRPQAQLPPNYGTVQYWSERVQTGIATGQNTVQVLRVGNLIRNLIFIGRETSSTGARSDEVFPEFPIINWDARQLFNETLAYRKTLSQEQLETNQIVETPPLPAGVFAYTFNKTNQSRAGDDKPWLWLPTVEATRLELVGNYAKGGVVQVLVNDVAPAEVNPTQRYAVPSATGFHPETGTRNPNVP